MLCFIVGALFCPRSGAPMPKKRDFSHVRVFNEMSEDAKRALALGDVELDDVLSEELGVGSRAKLKLLVRSWGVREGIT